MAAVFFCLAALNDVNAWYGKVESVFSNELKAFLILKCLKWFNVYVDPRWNRNGRLAIDLCH